MSESVDSTPTTYNLLFVCTGNTCRSPMAAALAREELDRRGWKNVAVRSAGVAATPGAPASENAVRVAWEHGLDLTSHEARPLTPALAEWADLILAMSPSHRRTVEAMAGEDRVLLLGSLLGEATHEASIDDPFGGDVHAYAQTFGQIRHAVHALLDQFAPILSP